ncbi:MAG TPA: hypothetical protein VFN21_11715, partial [Acidimicrobiales bacterium]|nr:hypothetical protein [Acidimicrobiales bacterium]
MPVGVELGSYYVSIAPNAQGIERSLATQVGPAAAAAGKQSEKAIAGGIASGAESGSAQAKKSIGGISKVALGLGAAFAA